MLLDSQGGYFVRLRSVVALSLVPIQYIINWPVYALDWVGSSFSSHKALVTENAELRAQNLLLQVRMQKLLSLEQENMHLRALLKSSEQLEGEVLVAQILNIDPKPFTHQVIINKGQKDGVYLGQPVLDASGVMGQVIGITPISSHVQLITDNKSAIPVQSNRTGFRSVARGIRAQSVLELMYVPESADIKVGDTMVTSGLGGRFPPGYPVGTVNRIEQIPGQHFSNIYLKPSAHFDRSRQVLVYWADTEKAQPLSESKHE